MNRKFKIIACIADVHIGNKAISWEEYKYQIKHGCIKKLEQMTFLDGIVICGDTTHYQISLNSDYARVFQWFVSKLVKIAKKKGAFIRFIKGTKSHDLDQLETVRHYENDFGVDFKIYDKVAIEEIDGCNYAFIPEEYIPVKSMDKYYSIIFDKKAKYFDMIFGHGTIEQTQFTTQDSENIDTHAPVFKLKDFYKVCKGPIIFGHIHTPMVFNNRFYYVGSLLRTCHGEEEDKGWNIVAYDPNSHAYRVDKIVNEYTFNFHTIELDNFFIETKAPEDIISYIENFMKERDTDKLSLKVNCIDKEETNVKIDILKKYFSSNRNITTSFKVLSEKAYQINENIKKDKTIKPYLQDGLSIVERIQLWSKEKRGYSLSDDDVLKYITDKKLKRSDKIC